MPEQKEVATCTASTFGVQQSPLKRFKVVKIGIILIAIILIIGGPAGFFIYEQQSFDNTLDAVETQLSLCLDNALKNAVLRTGVQGGKDSITEISYTKQSEFKANYLHFNGVSLLPSEDQLAEAIGEHAAAQLNGCAEELDTDSVHVTTDGGSIDVELGDKTTATVTYGFTVQNRLFGRDITDLTSTVDIDSAAILSPVRDIVDHVFENKGISDLSVVKPEGHTVTYVLYPEDKVLVFLVRSEAEKIDGVAHAFLFAVDTA